METLFNSGLDITAPDAHKQESSVLVIFLQHLGWWLLMAVNLTGSTIKSLSMPGKDYTDQVNKDPHVDSTSPCWAKAHTQKEKLH